MVSCASYFVVTVLSLVYDTHDLILRKPVYAYVHVYITYFGVVILVD